MNTSPSIVRITADSPNEIYPQLARIHRQELEHGFLSSLGDQFLSDLYRGLVQSPQAFLFAAIHEDEVVGFICGSLDTAKVYRNFCFSNGLQTAVRLLPKLISWGRIRRLTETVLYPSRNRDLDLPKAEILNFGVDRHTQRMGIGKQLFAALVGEFRLRQVERIRIVTGESQVKAQRFYESLNARRQTEIEVHQGASSVVYVFDMHIDVEDQANHRAA